MAVMAATTMGSIGTLLVYAVSRLLCPIRRREVGLFLVKSPVGGIFSGETYRETALAERAFTRSAGRRWDRATPPSTRDKYRREAQWHRKRQRRWSTRPLTFQPAARCPGSA